MNNYISDLVDRMSDTWSYMPGEKKKEGLFESGKSISSNATEEARHLDKIELLEDLYTFLLKENDDQRRNNAFFIIGQIARNTNNIDATGFLIEKLRTEKNNTVLVTILNCIAELFKPKSLDISPIVKLTEHRNWHVRGLSFEALTNTEHSVERLIIDKLKGTRNEDDIQYALSALQYVGTKTSLPFIEPYLKSRKHGINTAAVNGYAVIMLREGFETSAIAKKVRLSEDIVKILQERLPHFTRPG